MQQIPPIQCKKTTRFLLDFIQEVFGKAGFSNVVIGLSGGIDSAVVATLLTEVLGKEHIYAYFLPYTTSNPVHASDADILANQLGFSLEVIPIDKQLDIYFSQFDVIDPLRRGNKMARERMSILFDQAKVHTALVAGTSNKTETVLGYGTWFGDTAWSFNPIGDIYKTHIFQLARFLEIPTSIISKPPSADLWIGQTDEQELGFSYELIDTYLYSRLNENKTPEQLIAEGFAQEFIQSIEKRMQTQTFKRVGGSVASLPLSDFIER